MTLAGWPFSAGNASRKRREFCSPPHRSHADAEPLAPRREGGDPPPGVRRDRPRRKALWALRDALRRYQGPERLDRKGRLQAPRPTKCGWTVCGLNTGVLGDDGRVRRERFVEVRHGEHGASYAGLVTCSSVWACPVCSASIRSTRGEEVTKAIDWHGKERVVLLSLTVRHGLGDDVKQLAGGVANAWRWMTRQASWKRLARRLGIEHTIRALELTHGSHGWHPHLHVLSFLEGEDLAQGDTAWRLSSDAQKEGHRAISRLWRRAVVACLGAEHEPDDWHGVDVRGCHRSNYVTKMGLEVVDPAHAKRGRAGRSPWQLAHDLASYQGDGAQTVRRRERDAALWLAFVAGTRGRKMLTWSRELKQLAGVGELDDGEAADQPGPSKAIGYLNLPTWKALRLCGGREELLRVVERAAAGEHDVGRVRGELQEGEVLQRAMVDWLHWSGVWRPPDG